MTLVHWLKAFSSCFTMTTCEEKWDERRGIGSMKILFGIGWLRRSINVIPICVGLASRGEDVGVWSNAPLPPNVSSHDFKMQILLNLRTWDALRSRDRRRRV